MTTCKVEGCERTVDSDPELCADCVPQRERLQRLDDIYVRVPRVLKGRITDSRAPLAILLEPDDPVTTLLLLAGPPGSSAEIVFNEVMLMSLEVYQAVFLIESFDGLKEGEANTWFSDQVGAYAVIRKDTGMVIPGSVSDLLWGDEGDSVSIRQALARTEA